jgi:hypothetical protein
VEVLYQFWPRGTTISHGGENRYTEEVAEAFDSALRRVHCRLNTVAWSHRNTATFCTQSQESFNQDDRWTGPWPPARSAPNRKPGSPTIVAVRKHTRKATTSKAGGATTRPGPPLLYRRPRRPEALIAVARRGFLSTALLAGGWRAASARGCGAQNRLGMFACCLPIARTLFFFAFGLCFLLLQVAFVFPPVE